MAATGILANWNGQIGPLEDVKIPATDRAFLFADAAYEALRIYRGKPWLVRDHFARFARTLEGLRIPCDLARFETRLRETLAKSGAQEAIVYCQISRGAAAKRAHLFPKELISASELLWVEPIAGDPHDPYRERGASVITTEDQRWGRRDLKTVGLLANCLARQAAQEKNCQEAILYEKDGRVTEATASNVFVVVNNRLLTAPLGTQILPGVTRAFVVKLARELGLTVEEKFFSRDVLEASSEVFLTGTSTEVLPVTRIDGRYVGEGKPGPVTTQLYQAFRAKVDAFVAGTTE